MFRKIRGNKVTTTKDNQEIFASSNKAKIRTMTNASIHNMGKKDANLIINSGDTILIQADEVITLGDVVIGSIIVKESGSEIRYIGVE